MDMERIVRGKKMRIKRKELVKEEEELGEKRRGVIKRNIIKNEIGKLIVLVKIMVKKEIIMERIIYLIGIGVKEKIKQIGIIIQEGEKKMRGERWKLIWNEEKMKIIMFEMKLIGEGMRERIEKKDR